MENKETEYILLDGQRLTEEEYQKLKALQPVIVRWMTDDEMKAAIEKANQK